MLRVALGGFTEPWTFGPYARQLVILAAQLAQRYLVLWIALSYQDTEPKFGAPNLPQNVLMVGGGFPRNQGIYVSQLNVLLREYKIDVLITLMDLNRVFVDEMLAPYSIAWFPNHFMSLDLHSRHGLTAFDAVAVLGPSDAKSVAAQLPHKHVTHIPHVIEDKAALLRTPRSKLRAKYDVPTAAFVALVNFANYDELNRKSIDLSLLAWKAFHEAHSNSLLYLHAVTPMGSRSSLVAAALPAVWAATRAAAGHTPQRRSAVATHRPPPRPPPMDSSRGR